MVANLGYVRLEMQHPDAWAKFGVEILGFGKAKSRDRQGTRYLRMDKAPFRYMIEKGKTDRFAAAGYEMASQAAFVAQIKAFEKVKLAVTYGDDRDARRRAVKGFASVVDPSGNRVEFYYGRDKQEPFTPGHGIKEFKTGKMGLGHLVLPAPEMNSTIRFYKKLMGFAVSDDLRLPPCGRTSRTTGIFHARRKSPPPYAWPLQFSKPERRYSLDGRSWINGRSGLLHGPGESSRSAYFCLSWPTFQ